MAYQPRDFTGTLWINDRKGDNEKAADRTGSAIIEGVEYFVDGWLKETKPDAEGKTKKFLSLTFKRKQKQAGQPSGATGRPGRPRPPQQPQRQRPEAPGAPRQRPTARTLDPQDPATGEYKF